AAPLQFSAVGSETDDSEINLVSRAPSGEAAKFAGIVLRSKVAAASPGLVADSPIADVKRIFESCGCAFVGKGRAARGRVAVLHPAVELLGGKAAKVGGQVWRTAD